MSDRSETKPPADEGRLDRRVRRDAETDERREAQRKRLAELLQGRKQTPLKWNEFGNYPLTEME
jgi:hypothetical protein